MLLLLLVLQLLLVATAAVGRPATPGPHAVLHRENICSVAHSLDCRSFARGELASRRHSRAAAVLRATPPSLGRPWATVVDCPPSRSLARSFTRRRLPTVARPPPPPALGRPWAAIVDRPLSLAPPRSWLYYYYTYIPRTRLQVYSTRYILWGLLAVALDVDHPTQTPTRTGIQTLWGEQCLDDVAFEGSGLIRPKGDAVDAECTFQNSRMRVC